MDGDTKVFLIAIGIFVVIVLQMFSTVKNETVTGEVIDVELLDDYMIVTFDNGEIYNINYYGNGYTNIDLTVNSVMRIELHYMNPFIYPNVNNVWRVTNIVKVPDVGGE